MSALVVIPTYNELENLPSMVERVRASVPEAHVLVADDASPDGTGQLADRLAAADDHVHVMHRKGKEGLGAAYLAAFDWALGEGYDVIVQMDADGSHLPEQLPDLLGRLDGPGGREPADLVIGSRWVPGGEIQNWPKRREWLSRGGSTYVRLMLRVPVRDATAGYRVWRASALQALPLAEVDTRGYGFQVDMLWLAIRNGLAVAEVPVTFVERVHGRSKMSMSIVVEAMWNVTLWGVRSWFQPRSKAVASAE